jgi:hypothetical protein
MNNDDSQRMNMQNPGMRKPMSSAKYPEKSPNYSPSTSYNYSPQTGHTGGQAQMNPRRRTDNFRRDTPNSSDRILRQNDIIIRLLKEIRDRLPAPAIIEKEDIAAEGEGADVFSREDSHRGPAAEKPDESGELDGNNTGFDGPDNAA